MNKVFKVIWNSGLNVFIVASELAKGYCKTAVRKMACVCHTANKNFIFTILFLGTNASAENLQIHDFSPQIQFEQKITGTNTLTGSFEKISRGAEGFVWTTLGQAKAEGLITKDSVQWVDKNIFRLGSQTKSISYIDPVTGNTMTMNVYDNNDIQIEPARNFMVVIPQAVGRYGQYVDRNLYQIGAGAFLNVDVGSKSNDWVKAADNQFNIIMKSSRYNENLSSAYHVTDGGHLSYQSKTVVQLGNNNNNIKDASNALAWMTAADFVGEFDSVIGKQNIKNIDDFKAYNDALIKAIQNGEVQLTEEQYANELNKARDTSLHGIFINTENIPTDDAIRAFVNKDAVSYIHAVGTDSSIDIAENANIQLTNSDATLVNLEDGASLTNNGTLGTAGNTIKGAYVVAAKSGAIFNNNGVIDAGTSPEMADFFSDGSKGVAQGVHTGIIAYGNSIINNNGIINIASRGDYYGNTGVLMNNNSTFNNTGIINIAASEEASSILSNGANIGVVIQQDTTFNNSGTLYIGRTAQRSPDDKSTDIAIKQQSIGVHLYGNGVYNSSETSQIIIGSNVQNATAIDVGGNATLSQMGRIDINGTASGDTVSSNQGIIVREGTQATKVIHDGIININGLNSTGIHVLENGQIASSGIININGGLDTATHYTNYGIFSQGENALAILSGTVNLSGDGAIGVHARDKGEIDVTENGAVNFINGVNQTGYYIFGSGSTIKNATTSTQDASTKNSTLYRVDGGASFNGALHSSAQLNASGNDSTIIRTTGTGSYFDSGKLALSVTGTGATGIRIEGGATGEISPDTVIVKVAGKNTTAGIVDGNYYRPDGTVSDSQKGNSVLTSHAILETANTADGAFGYIARNDGRLIHKGSINFTAENSTGILVDGGALENHSDVSVNGVAVNIQGENSVVTNSGTVSATNGQAAYLIGDNATLALNGHGETIAAGTAHAILLDSGAKGLTIDDATISMDYMGSGNAVENKAAISGIQLKNTTINVGNGAGIHTGASMASENSGIINVNGRGTGILFENVADGTDTNQILDMSDSRNLIINVNSPEGNGIITRSTTDLKTGASINVLNKDGKSALTVLGSTKNVEQSGRLTSVSDKAPVVNLNNGYLKTFTNKGDILTQSEDHIALEMNRGNGVMFINASNANIVGQVNLYAGDNTVLLESGSTATDINSGNGEDNYILKGVNEDESDRLFKSLDGGSGNDTLQLNNSSYILDSADAINNIEHIELMDYSTFTLNNILSGLNNGINSPEISYNIDSTSKLNIKNTADFQLKSHLAGTGTVTIDLANHQFNFDSNNSHDGFAGTLALFDTMFELGGNNTSALNNATLQIGNGSIVHVNRGKQYIGGVSFNGGIIQFDDATPGNLTASGTVYAGTMNLSGHGKVQVDRTIISNERPWTDEHLSILEQDDAHTLIKLATSDTRVQGSAGNLILEDRNSNVISNAITDDIVQDGTIAAKGTYDYRLTSSNKHDGLYINYGLTQLDLLSSGTDALVFDANGKTGNAADMSARITGTGDLAFNSQKGETVSLSNQNNDYTGVTDIRGGNVLMNSDSALGQTSEIRLAAGTMLDMNGHSQTAGKLNGATDSVLNINGGNLTLTEGGISAGSLTGNGSLNISGGELDITAASNALAVNTTIAKDAAVRMNDVSGLGTGNISNAGTLSLSHADGTLGNNLSGTGTVSLLSSDTQLSGNNSNYSGQFVVDGGSQLTVSAAENLGSASVSNTGTLVLNSTTDWKLVNDVRGTGNILKTGSGSLTVGSNAGWTGATDIDEGALILGNTDAPVMLASSQVTIADKGTLSGYGGVTGNVTNRGTLDLRADAPGNVLTVGGNYTGNNGTLLMNTVLGDDSSVTDKLVIKGDASGQTRVAVTNAGGTGAQTLNGIELIHVDGNADSAEFTQTGRITAGAYDYTLGRGQGSHSSNWYLTSGKNTPAPLPEPEQKPEQKPGGYDNDLRPEVGSYTANMAAANTMFVTRLHERLGQMQYTDVMTGEKRNTSMWMRHEGGHNRWHDGTGQLKTQGNRYVVQLGGDIAQWGWGETDRWHLGVMAGYGNEHNNTDSVRTGYRSKGSVNGYSTGLYATWYGNDETHNGAYLDTWAQYSWFDNHMKGDGLPGESWKSKGLTASLETGYTWKAGEFSSNYDSLNEWYVQPQAQVIWMGVKADKHRESNGTRVESTGDGNIRTRLGVKTWIKGHNRMDNGKSREFSPFVEVNWLHNTRDFGTRMNGVTVHQDGARNIGEVKAGVEGQISDRLNLWGNVGVQAGDRGYSDTSAMLGVKYTF